MGQKCYIRKSGAGEEMDSIQRELRDLIATLEAAIRAFFESEVPCEDCTEGDCDFDCECDCHAQHDTARHGTKGVTGPGLPELGSWVWKP